MSRTHHRQEPPQKERHLKPIIAEPKTDELRQLITDICFENGGVTKPMVDKLEAQLRLYIEKEVLKGRIEELKKVYRAGGFFVFENATDEYISLRLAELTAPSAPQKEKQGDEYEEYGPPV